jgi:hypothetical protein
MPSAEDILRARDSEDVSAPEREEPSRIPTDYPEQKPSHDEGEGEESKPRREVGDPRPEPESDDGEDTKQVPLKALHAEREKSKRYTEEVVDLRRQIAELTQAVLAPKPQPQPQPEPQKSPEFDWDKPIETIHQQIESRITQERQAIAAEFQRQREAVQSQFAITRHGEEAVKSAYAALAEARETDPQWAMDYRRIMTSPDQYEAMVQWHKQRSALQEVGSDLDAYKAKIRAEYLEELRHGKPTLDEPREAARSPGSVMPSNLSAARSVGSRNGPAWQGPTSIKDIFANR